MFLFNYYYFKTVDYEIQIEQLSHPFIVLIFLFIEKDQKLKMFFFLSFILLFKENQAIVWISVGFYYIFLKKTFCIFNNRYFWNYFRITNSISFDSLFQSK